MNIEKLKQKILTKLSKKELEKRVNEKIEENSGLLGEESAVMLVAQEFGIEITYDDDEEYDFSIKDIQDGQKNVEVSGKIIEVSNTKEFSKKDGSTGKLASITIGDNTGTTRLTLWNDKTELIEGLKKGDVIKIENAFSRKWNDKVELNSGSELSIEKLKKYDESRYPILKENYSISELLPNLLAKINAEVILAYPKKEFSKKDGTTGQLKSLTLKDSTGSIRVTLWNELADFEVKKGDYVEVKGYAKQGYSGLELSADNITIIREGQLEESLSENLKISELTDFKGEFVNVSGNILTISPSREVSFNDRTSEVQDLYISDDTGRVKIAFWGLNKDVLKELNNGDYVKISNCKLRNYNDNSGEKRADLTYSYLSELKKDKKLSKEIEEIVTPISEILSGKANKNDVTVVGMVVSAYPINEFKRSNGSTGKVKNITIDDNSGSIRMSLWDNYAEMAILEGDILKIVHGYVKESGEYMDLSVGRFGQILVNPKGISVKSNRSFIVDIEEGKSTEIRGTVVDFRKQDLILNLCPNCRKKLNASGKEYVCETCGTVTPNELLVSTVAIDDGTSVINCRIYGQNVEKITGMSKNELKSSNLDALSKILGRDFIFYGSPNIRNDELEFSVKSVSNIDINREIDALEQI
ncbi:nucleic acid binding OB-fold tRNA/helicase-type [Methanococcus vannielii SB]|uniref:Nucleic acid binding OB-fold tRNA/helicase-type n=1 Tax=Methanococcus vannielii (strain ATCC 35089 / DSM 1224 / JCM 13029 / OCM 148 / SB) TaxID=406327 RepID=A6UP42_METVS|nr:OB-fold nucleic acid binding domain-containing protein [Methanococcus vannielii]ABR54264.1 nucleic acid binding OB-fold tRNA/helicase-type [Methanococcus vannielii SB]